MGAWQRGGRSGWRGVRDVIASSVWSGCARLRVAGGLCWNLYCRCGSDRLDVFMFEE